MVKTFASGESQSAGAHSYNWEGKNDSGVLAPLPNAYYFTIEAQDGTGRVDKYIPPVIDSGFFGSNPTQFNPYANDLLPVTFNLSAPARLSLDVFVANQVVYNLGLSEPFTSGDHTIYWDGRDSGGNLIPVGFGYSIFQYVPSGLPENVIITKDETLKVSHLLANQYVIVPVFGEFSKITYELPTNAQVTLNIKDPNGNHVKNVADRELQTQGSYEFSWDGTNDNGGYTAVPGHYTLEFFIEHASQTNSSYRRGNVTVVR